MSDFSPLLSGGPPPQDPGDKYYQDRVVKFWSHLIKNELTPFKCHACKAENTLVLYGFKYEVTVTPTSTVGRYYPNYDAYCSKCGFIHSFNAEVVEGV